MTGKNIAELFTDEEILGIREGIDGIKRTIPSRFYHDEAIYHYEVEHLLRKNWLCVGRWDRVEHPGDYFTMRMWQESIVIVRDNEGALHALVNVCQHRYTQVVGDGCGNSKLFTCPYHSWTYNLDGSLRGVTLAELPGFDKDKCSMPKLRIEEWQGFIFINFDSEAKPLAPQVAVVNPHFEEYKVSEYRERNAVDYEASWNWKFSFETGYEGYHHCGLHRDRINNIVPGNNTRPLDFGEACGSYTMWMKDDPALKEKMEQREKDGYLGRDPSAKFIGIYPNLIMFLNSKQVTYIITQHQKVDFSYVSTRQAFSPKVLALPKAEKAIAEQDQSMRDTQDEDTYGCTMLQKGVSSRTNTTGVIHPLEQQLNHYHNWYLDQLNQ